MSRADEREYRAGLRRWKAELRRRRVAAANAIQSSAKRSRTVNYQRALATISYFLSALSSETRLDAFLSISGHAPPAVFWPALLNNWSSFDNTWIARTALTDAMKQAGSAYAFLSTEQRAFFDSLPDDVKVYRGCSASRIRGVAWTADRSVAKGFARGHRDISVPDPVIASAIIPTDAIFFATDDRKEMAIVLNPRRLRGLAVEEIPFECPPGALSLK